MEMCHCPIEFFVHPLWQKLLCTGVLGVNTTMGNMEKIDAIAIVALAVALFVGICLSLVIAVTCCLLFRTRKDLRVLSKCWYREEGRGRGGRERRMEEEGRGKEKEGREREWEKESGMR